MKNTLSLLSLLSLSPLLLLLLCFTSIAQAATGSISLGNLQFTDAVATHAQTPASQTIDRTFIVSVGVSDAVNGWSTGSRTVSDNITWAWQTLSPPSLSQGESVDYYTYTINIYSGYSPINPQFNYYLRAYSLSLLDPANTNTFSTITDYQSVSNTQQASTISVDTDGLITTTQPNPNMGFGLYDMHTLIFKSKTLSKGLRLTTIAGQAGWADGNFLLREIDGSATATVVPEPSTYALFLGLAALLYRLTKKKKGLAKV